MKGYRKYFGNKMVWFLITLVFAFILNFILPRLMPGDPVAVIVARLAQGMTSTTGVQAIYQAIRGTVWYQQTHARAIFPLREKCGAG